MRSYTVPAWQQSIYINNLELFFMGDLAIILHLFIYSIIHISMD